MGFNGKTIIGLGIVFFVFQLINFISINEISPEIERAQVLAAFSSLIIILIGLLFERIETKSGDKILLKGDNKFIYDEEIPKDILEELAWGSEAILTSTAAASILINYKGKNILRRGIVSQKEFNLGEISKRSIKNMKMISLVNTKFYPGKEEFDDFCPNLPSILIFPVKRDLIILIGGWSTRCFTKSDEKWIMNWIKRLPQIFEINKY
tara:strand:+ start:1508 stop:2134 length:627 start_codon:yes stop_codon:yes gene_type:complete